MPRPVIMLLLLACCARSPALEIAGVTLPAAAAVAGQDLALRGGHLLRWRRLVRIYVAALYLPPATAAAQALDDIPRRIAFHYARGFSADDLVQATDATIVKGLDEATVAAIRPALAAFNALYPAVREGDVMEIDYHPGVGTSMRVNGTRLGTVPGAGFARALFAIWLGEHAVDDGLKAALLGAG